MKIKKTTLINYVMAFCILFFPYWSSFRNVFVNGFMYTIVAYIPIFFALIKNINRRKITVDWLDLVLLSAIIFMLFNNWDFRNHSYFTEIIHLSIFAFYILYRNNQKIINCVLNLMMIYAIYYAIWTVILFIFKDFYILSIVPIFNAETQKDLLMIFAQGGVSGFTTHYSLNAIYLALGTIVAYAKYKSTANKKYFWIMCFLFACILITGKRAQSIFVFLSLLICYWVFQRKKITGLFKVLAAGALAVGAIIILSKYIPGLSNVIERMQVQSSNNDISSGRYLFWNVALSQFKYNPILGAGWNRFQYYYLLTEGTYINVHNVYIQILYETGIVGFTVYITIFITFLVRTVRDINYIYKEHLNNAQNSYLLMFAFSVQLFFLMYCVTGNPLYDAQTFLPYMVGGMIAYQYRGRGSSSKFQTPKRVKKTTEII